MDKSQSGEDIIHHTDTTKQTSLSPSDAESMKKIEEHIEENIGPIHMVFHEMVSELVHLDVYWIKPTETLNFNILVTNGVSSRPMKTPKEMKGLEYIELAILLPPDWRLTMEELQEEENYWPIRLLKDIGRLPHMYDSWIGYGHTIENEDSQEDYSKFASPILLPSATLGEKFFTIKINSSKVIYFYCLIPIFKDELELKLSKGIDSLTNLLNKREDYDVVNMNRTSVCK